MGLRCDLLTLLLLSCFLVSCLLADKSSDSNDGKELRAIAIYLTKYYMPSDTSADKLQINVLVDSRDVITSPVLRINNEIIDAIPTQRDNDNIFFSYLVNVKKSSYVSDFSIEFDDIIYSTQINFPDTNYTISESFEVDSLGRLSVLYSWENNVDYYRYDFNSTGKQDIRGFSNSRSLNGFTIDGIKSFKNIMAADSFINTEFCLTPFNGSPFVPVDTVKNIQIVIDVLTKGAEKCLKTDSLTQF